MIFEQVMVESRGLAYCPVRTDIKFVVETENGKVLKTSFVINATHKSRFVLSRNENGNNFS